MAATTTFSVRMDSDIKKQCEALYGELGLTLPPLSMCSFASRSASAVFLLTFAWSNRTRRQWRQCWKQDALPVIRL